MKAKFIYEVFTDESDPIKDMGIGGFIKNRIQIINMYAKHIPGYYLTYDDILTAYHPNSKKILWNYADEQKDFLHTNKYLIHWKIIDRYIQ